MTYGQSAVLLSAYFGGFALSLRPIGRLITRDSTIDPHEQAGAVVLFSLIWPVFWICALVTEGARRHLQGIRRYDEEIVAQAVRRYSRPSIDKAYGGTD